jgi:peptide/nickel transport system substrate-binding protein
VLRGISLATAVALLCVACSRTSEPVTVTPASSISFNVSEDPNSLNPILARSDDERQLAHLAFDMLLDVDASGRPIPALARVVPSRSNGGVSADGRTIVYHLRPDVRWQDGARFDSRDVEFTWRAIVDPRNAVSSTRGYDLIDAIDTPDPLTAIVHLRRAWTPAVQTLFTYGDQPVPVLPAHLLAHADRTQWERFGTHPVGTGPFALQSWARGSRLVYTANRAYYRGLPLTPRIVVMVVPDFNTDLTLLRTGELDWSLLSPAQRRSLDSTPGIHFVYAPFAGVGALAFNLRRPPFNDASMRRAFVQSIDRQRLSSALTRGQYRVTDSGQPVFSWAYDPSARMPAFDPIAADRALDALGWRRGPSGVRERDHRPLEIGLVVFPEGETAVRTAVYVQQMLAARGIVANIKRVSLARFYLPKEAGGVLLSGDFDVAYVAWRTGEDPDDGDFVTCAGVTNYAGYCNAEVDALEARALTTPTRSERARLYGQVQHILARDVPYAYLYAPTYGYGVRDGVAGFAPTPFSPISNAWRWQRR